MFTPRTLYRVLFTLLMSVSVTTALFPAIGAAQTQPVKVTITQIQQWGDNFDPTSLGDFYAHVTINGTVLSTFDDRFSFDGGYLVPSGYLAPNPPWVLKQEVPLGLATVPIIIELFDDDLLTGREQADLNPGPSNNVNLILDLATGKWSGDVEWPQNCIAGPIDDDFDNQSAEVCFSIDADSDGDGLLNSWEQNGFDANGDGTIDVNLPAFGAHPQRKDVFVEVDCLVATDHSHCPRQDAVADVVQSFARAPVANVDGTTTGVQLHVDVGPLFGAGNIVSVPGTGGVIGTYGDFGGGGNQIAEAGNEIIESFNSPQGSAIKFATLRANFFDSQRDLLFRYAIFGHQTNARRVTNDCTSGEANKIPGNEFFVTLGGLRIGTLSPCWTTDANGFSVGSRVEQAGTFMHELGHLVGLQHGGDESIFNNKPNYLSVMNYTFQQCSVTPSPNGFLPGGCDYSRIALPPLVPASLDETNLDECIGIDAGQLGFGPLNWNGNTVLEGITCQPPNTANVQFDINGDGGALPVPLTGFNDWNSLAYSLVDIASAGGSGTVPVPQNEADPETISQSRLFMGALLEPGIEVDKTGPATALPGELLTYTTDILNQGRGPALNVVRTDTGPDGVPQVDDIGAIVVGDIKTRTSNFTVPHDACPGDFTGATASVTFKDFVGNQLAASGSAPLQILDVIPPTLTVTVSPTTLWPPNHKFQNVTAVITVTDNCDHNSKITLVSVASNEPETGFLGNGDQGPDIQGAVIGTDDRAFSLRSERGTGGQNTGRVYTITYRATDISGNTTEKKVLVTVPTNGSGLQ